MNPELLSFMALIVALTSTIINYLMLHHQYDPEVIVYALPDQRRPTIINIIIENIGKGRATHIRFESDHPIPKRAFGFDDAETPDVMDDGPFIHGISALAPGEKRTITWGQYGGLTKGLNNNILEITAIYKSHPSFQVTPKKHLTTSNIDLKSFEGTDASDNNWDKKAAEQLEEIAKTLKKLAEHR
ncbi:hypothetical protein FO488_16020 [Geobacter sp. FeAm09]|uniref:hypothetical protein n=1 Tax=Geobacter sp. FeAm09 TaxID=2597769 RepID=UPI0011EFC593|nr:hypothetical protein [Geobacter sp. FeAm09]QEM69515.1 hypothetical protein FO488_16020 [Geobacter sp. FeAm09]